MRDPPPRTEGGISMGIRKKCFCGNFEEVSKMFLIPDTGVVRNVVSRVCRNCPSNALGEIKRCYALVCAGCKEVVITGEPHTEPRTGFKWEAGKCYHVPNCPECLNRPIKSSPVIEQKLWYQDHGFPYVDDGEI